MQEELEWTKDDLAVFQIFDTTDENDLEVLCEGIHFDKDEEDRSDRTGAYQGMIAAR